MDEQALLDRICEAYYLPAWCSVADYKRLFEAEGLQVAMSSGRGLSAPVLRISAVRLPPFMTHQRAMVFKRAGCED